MKKYLLIMYGAKATPPVFETAEAAGAAANKIMAAFRNVTECRAVDERLLQHYVQVVYGDEYYAAYAIYDGEWYVHECPPYDTAACDWCSLGGRFCEECNRTGEDPFEQCGEQLDMFEFCEWLDKVR